MRTLRTLIFGVVFLLGLNPMLIAAPSPKIESGKKVTLAYKLYVDGTLLEVADSKNPFIYEHGKQQIVPGLEKNLTGLQVGDQKTVRVSPQEAYGFSDPKALQEVLKEKFPQDIPMEKGTFVEARNPEGAGMLVRIAEVREKTVILDFNHPLTGKKLEFQVEVLNIK